MTPGRWSPLRPAPDLLRSPLKAPIPVPEEPGTSYRKTLEILLEGSSIPHGPREAALSTGVTLIHGAQEVIAALNLLTAEGLSPARVQEIARHVLRQLSVLERERSAAYVLHQVAELVEARHGAPPEGLSAPSISRLKGFIGPLERSLEALDVPRRMEPDRFAALIVHLDDMYDDASIQVQQLFALAELGIDDARLLAPEYLRRLYLRFAHASLEDHLLSPRLESRSGCEPEEGRGAGLLALLPELIQALE